MQLISHCRKCGEKLIVPLPESTTEIEANALAQELLCAGCWRGVDKTPSTHQSPPEANQSAARRLRGAEQTSPVCGLEDSYGVVPIKRL